MISIRTNKNIKISILTNNIFKNLFTKKLFNLIFNKKQCRMRKGK